MTRKRSNEEKSGRIAGESRGKLRDYVNMVSPQVITWGSYLRWSLFGQCWESIVDGQKKTQAKGQWQNSTFYFGMFKICIMGVLYETINMSTTRLLTPTDS